MVSEASYDNEGGYYFLLCNPPHTHVCAYVCVHACPLAPMVTAWSRDALQRLGTLLLIDLALPKIFVYY